MRTTQPEFSRAAHDRRLRGCAVAVLVLSMIVCVGAAWARETVVLIASDDPVLERKLRAEVAQLGLVARELSVAPPTGDAAALTREGAVAVIRVELGGPARLFVVTKDGDTVVRRVARRPGDDDGYALRVVEALRGELLELELLPSAARPPSGAPEGGALDHTPPSTPEGHSTRGTVDANEPTAASLPLEADHDGTAAALPSRAAARVWLDAGLGTSAAQGGMGAVVQGAIGLAVEPTGRLRIAGDVLLPLTDATWQDRGASGSASVTLVLARLSYMPLSGPWGALDAGLGAGLATLALKGQVAPPLEGRTEQLFTGVFVAHGGAAWALAPWFRLRATAFGGVSAPRPVARFDGEPTATWGRLVGGATLSGEFGLALSGPGAGQ